MLIFDGNSRPMIIDNINGPVITEHMWVLDLQMLDYTLAPLTMLEETITPVIQLMCNGFRFNLPASWNILVYDRDTAQLDVVQLSDCAGREFTAMSYGPKRTYPSPYVITVTDYIVEQKIVGPSLLKHQMLCHPIGYDEWVTVSPTDTYNKYLKNLIVGDLIGQ